MGCPISARSWHDFVAMFAALASSLIPLRSVAGDPSSTRTVYAVVIALAVIGVGLIVLGIWMIRQTRVEPVLLAPLERMADRRWRRSDPTGRRRLLDDVRPEGAEPVHRAPDEPEIDEEFDAEPPVPSFDDLDPILLAYDIDPRLLDVPAPAADALATGDDATGDDATVDEPASDDRPDDDPNGDDPTDAEPAIDRGAPPPADDGAIADDGTDQAGTDDGTGDHGTDQAGTGDGTVRGVYAGEPDGEPAGSDR